MAGGRIEPAETDSVTKRPSNKREERENKMLSKNLKQALLVEIGFETLTKAHYFIGFCVFYFYTFIVSFTVFGLFSNHQR